MGLSNPGGSSPIKRTIYVGSSGSAANVTENATSVTTEEDVPLPPMRTVILENGKKVVKVDNIKSFMSGGSIRAIKKSKGKNCKKVIKLLIIVKMLLNLTISSHSCLGVQKELSRRAKVRIVMVSMEEKRWKHFEKTF